ncbi:MAG: transcriptional regulator [Deltaproteobacteria bacterium]|nr:transcriptional regulator [Deltaproteobacteria bacterium]RLB63292.1 MAG: transcriptional regulator [Deltaproteobacteria bacterium]
MVRKGNAKKKFRKVVSEQFPVNAKRGGGVIKIEAWENEKGEIIKYSMAYINHLIFSEDNGRVLGYDNTHDFHHKHYFGEMSEVSDFSTYQDLVALFEKEIKEFIR